MKRIKQIGKVSFWILVTGLLLAPILLIFRLSRQELAEYEPEEPPVILDSAYGEIRQVRNSEIVEYVTLSGTYVCNEFAYMELDRVDSGMIRWEVSVGDLITEGQKMGTYHGQDIVSTVTGILHSMNTYGEEPYLQFQKISPVELECQVDEATLAILQRENVKLATADGSKVSVSYISPLKNADGTMNVRIEIENAAATYGLQEEGIAIYTGRKYSGVLVIDADCVYRQGDKWYVRVVTIDGIVIGEQEVQIGYTNGSFICVTGLDEGTYCDAGYKAVVEGTGVQ